MAAPKGKLPVAPSRPLTGAERTELEGHFDIEKMDKDDRRRMRRRQMRMEVEMYGYCDKFTHDELYPSEDEEETE